MIYFIQDERGPIKIGHTAGRINLRLSYMQCSNPFQLRLLSLTDGDETTERSLHERFAQHRLRGEWFSPHAEILQFCAEVPVSEAKLDDDKTRMTITIDKSLKHEVTILAVKDARDVSAEIGVLVREGIASRKPKGWRGKPSD